MVSESLRGGHMDSGGRDAQWDKAPSTGSPVVAQGSLGFGAAGRSTPLCSHQRSLAPAVGAAGCPVCRAAALSLLERTFRIFLKSRSQLPLKNISLFLHGETRSQPLDQRPFRFKKLILSNRGD